MKTGKSLIEIIKAFVDSGKAELPVFNATAMKVRKELSKEEPDIRAIERMISTDQALTSQVLSMANSAFYQGLVKVTTIKNAIMRIGAGEVANIVLMVSQRDNFRAKDPFMKTLMLNLWRHSVGTGIATLWLARERGFKTLVNEAFFAGLLHDVGKLFILKALDHMKKTSKEPFDPSQQVVLEAMHSLHTEYGYFLMNKWNLPEHYCDVVKEHHNEVVDPKNFLLLMVRMADRACNNLGIGLGNLGEIQLSALPEAGYLNLSEIDLARLEIKLEDAAVLWG